MGYLDNIEAVLDDSPLPLYRKVEDRILQDIASGRLKEGDLLPSETDLAKGYGVHQGTVRKSILNLTQKGILYRKQGKGTFVVFQKNNVNKYLNYRFVSKEGSDYAQVNLALIDLVVVKADVEIAENLGLKKGAKVIQLERFGNIGNNSYVMTTSHLPKNLYPGLEKYTAEDFMKNTLWKLQEIYFKLRFKKREEFISAITADEKAAERLDTEVGNPILQIKMKATTETDDICEYRVSKCKLETLDFHISHE